MANSVLALDPIPMADPRADNALVRDELVAAATAVIERGPYILGPAVSAFESELANSLGVAGTASVGTGTDALVIAMLTLGVRPGDEVIVPSHTAGPSVAAIRIVGAIPVLVDVEVDTSCIDPLAVEQAIGPKVKAIIAVHLYGHPADMARLSAIAARNNIHLIEDCAQAQGATLDGKQVGSIGNMGCFSFYPTKNLGALGDGGAVSSVDPAKIEKAKALRLYGWATKPQFAEISGGRCSRLDEIQAAMLAVKLQSLPAWNDRRRAIGAAYDAAFADLPIVTPIEKPGARHVYHLYVIRSERRDALEMALGRHGIRTGRHYPFPVHIQPGLASGARIPAPLTVTERLQNEILSLPIFVAMSGSQVERTIAAVRNACQEVYS
jgi:dTDP-4-amino-4,6-dideoxygalactose transaminase